jgi:hypothetical protein
MSTFDTKANGVAGLKDKSQLKSMITIDGTEVVARYSTKTKGLIPMLIKDGLKAEEVSLKYLELGIACMVVKHRMYNKGYMIQLIKSDNSNT